MVRTYARAPKGRRAIGRAPAGRYERLTLLGAITLGGVSALMTIPAFTNRLVFAAFVEQILVPTLRPGQVVVLDNLPAHKYPEVAQAVCAAGCRLLFLPRYSPEYNPIELCWSKVKTELRSRAARTLDLLEDAVRTAVDHVTSGDARGFFRHCGYRLAPDP
jgi:transposase